jgi:UDP-N-acetylmuramoyl-L-alanyl-D-glutamate--2,6-diaminopimelate ligase
MPNIFITFKYTLYIMSLRSAVKKVIPKTLFGRIEPYGHWVEAIIENIVFGFPSRKLKVIGITGTAGKTTTSTMLTHMMRESGYKVAMMSTISIDYGDGKGSQANSTRMTSLGSLKLLQALKKINANKVEWLVLETTSQALSQHRVWGVPYTIVGFTNLGHDNFHYHRTFERYRKAKVMLFKQANRNKKGKRIGVVNIDDPNADYFISQIANPLTYGLKDGDLRAKDVELMATGSNFKAKINDDVYDIRSNLPGAFNVFNALAAVGIARAVGLSKKQIEQGIASLKSVEGRMNSIDEGQDFGIIVDYACTPDSFEQLYAAVKPLAKGRIISVFGSAGRRDELKRPLQGKIAAEHSDVVILSEEDDRDLDGQQILEEIAAGSEQAGKIRGTDLFLIHSREDAVEKAIMMAKKDDLVLLLGKGEEKVIITNKPGFKIPAGHIFNELSDTIQRPYNETATAKAVLKKLKA